MKIKISPELAKQWLCLEIDRWRVQEEKREVTTKDVVDFMYGNGFVGGRMWDEFLNDIPLGWLRSMGVDIPPEK